ncbi:MAG: iron-sulfur cluster assembly scaffold protein [Candidatus Puniceispirillaceae bacterium]
MTVDALYQKQILDYTQKARASKAVDQPTHTATLDNPTCGDRVTISLNVNGHNVNQIAVAVRGCALCEAGAGLVIECFSGQTDQAIRQLTDEFSDWLTGHGTEAPTPQMQHFTPVQSIRNRHKCVLLACHTTLKALSAE